MAYVDQSSVFGFGTKLTSTQQQNLRDNLDAAFAKDSGAPVLANDYIVTAMVASGQITSPKIAASGVDSANIATDAVPGNKIFKGIAETGSQHIAPTGSSSDEWTVPTGIYNVIGGGDNGGEGIQLIILAQGVWRQTATADNHFNGMVWSNSSNMRLRNTDADTQTAWFQKFE
jgi:hypothetical protein